MRALHNPAVRQELESRLAALRADAPRKWGTMTSDQMLWHLNQFMSWSIGEGDPKPPGKSAMPAWLMKFFLLHMPWPKGAPTNPKAKATGKYEFEAERARCKELIGKLSARSIDGPWPVDPSFGPVDGNFVSRLHAKHLDHHFKQFSG